MPGEKTTYIPIGHTTNSFVAGSGHCPRARKGGRPMAAGLSLFRPVRLHAKPMYDSVKMRQSPAPERVPASARIGGRASLSPNRPLCDRYRRDLADAAVSRRQSVRRLRDRSSREVRFDRGSGCRSKQIDLPGDRELHQSAFRDCRRLRKMRVTNPLKRVKAEAFDSDLRPRPPLMNIVDGNGLLPPCPSDRPALNES